MLDTQEFGDYLQSVGLRDFVGVPCSYLAPLINYAINSKRFIMSNNEGDAVAIASGISLCRLIHNNSSLGSHLQDCASLEAVITHKVTPAPKFTQNLQSNTALVRSTSPYLQNTRIVDSTPCHFERSEKSTSLESQVNSNNKDSQAEVSLSDFSGFQAKGEGSLLNANDRALSAESAKSTKEITPHNYGVVLMQNSGLSNALSPLTSLNYTFKIPILGFVSLRGERDSSGKNTDEPQHELLGVITDTLLETCEIKYAFLDSDMDRAKMQVQEALEWLEKGESFFFIVRDKTFSKVSLVSGHSVLSDKSRIASAEAAALTPSKLLASASQSHDLLKKPTAASLCTASLVFSSQSLECQDSSNMESQAHSTPCHTEALAEVSSTESKRDISPFSKARTSKALAHTCKYDKILESQADSSNTESKPDSKPAQPTSTMPTRLEALSVLHTLAKDSKALLLATTGKCGRELYEIEDSPNQLYMVGSMGCVSSLSLGIALKSRQKVIAIDGDSALLMRLGALSTNAYYTRDRDNFCHILLDNESHDSTGGQFNLSPFVDFSSIAKSCGYVNVCIAESLEEFELYVRLFLDARNSACGNSSLGSHLQDCASLEAVITHKVTPAPKFTQNLQSNTALVRSTRRRRCHCLRILRGGIRDRLRNLSLSSLKKKIKNLKIKTFQTKILRLRLSMTKL
ncbi:thiamine pyrophosphate-dependent enzyme [Helicobacter cinaedi]|uniref:thiamine pyrophosphate-dependent enzyme n=1 Tax=Helicobacter cinaedi TaxID=213 RepID=UPI001E362B6C|nr:thiamine pyrophosphate-dependent enzyme [Helicobacter cinaedi]